MDITIEQRQMARMLNLHPDKPASWPMEAIDRLVHVRATRPKIDFYLEFRSLTDYFQRRSAR